MKVVGTLKNQFHRTYIYADPQLIQGLDIWRDVNVPPKSTDFQQIGGVLPIVATETNGNTDVRLSFNILNLPEISSVLPPNTANKNEANFLLHSEDQQLPQAPTVTEIKTTAPIQKVFTNNVAILYFDIGTLGDMTVNPVEIRELKKIKVKTNSYNSSKSAGPSVSATAPMEADTIGSSVTVSFDINDLPSVTSIEN